VPTPDAGVVDREVEALLAEPGTLELRVYPYATVFIDGESRGVKQGKVPFLLPPGRHQVAFQHPSARPESYPVLIESGKTVKREFRADIR
jgi:hypothetical protein